MAIQSTVFGIESLGVRAFASTKHIPTKQHMAVWIQAIEDEVWTQVPYEDYELINNSCLLDTLIDTSIYKQIEIRVADSFDELTQSPTDITVVAGISDEVIAVAGVSTNIAELTTEPMKTSVLNGQANADTTDANVILSNADVVLTHADVVLTNADVVSTGLDVDATNADVITTNANAVLTNADVVTTNADVVTVGGIYDSFDDRYLGAKSVAPTVDNDGDTLITGALYFDTVVDAMKVRTSVGSWILAGSSINGTDKRESFVATEGQTVFTVTNGYDSGFADIYVDGIKLVNGVDVDVLNGSIFTLSEPVSAGTDVEIVAFGTFLLADTYTRAEIDAANADVDTLETITSSTGMTTNGALQEDILSLDSVETTGSTPILYTGTGAERTVALPTQMANDNGDGSTLAIDWNAVTAYTAGDIVIDNSATGDARAYKCIVDVTSATSPVVDDTNWKLEVNQYGGRTIFKQRSGDSASNHAYDSIRRESNHIYTDSTSIEATDTSRLKKVDTSSIIIGEHTTVNNGAYTYVLWIDQTIRKTAGYRTDAGVIQNSKNNTGTDLMKVDSAGNPIIEHYNPVTGFSIIMDTGNGVAGRNIPHSQQKEPKFIVKKQLTTTARAWMCYNNIKGATEFMYLDGTVGSSANSTVWNDTEPTEDNFTVGTNLPTNESGQQSITYLQCDTDNHKTKGYNGSGSVGNVVDLGLDMTIEGSWCMIKRLDTTSNWTMFDNIRGGAVALSANLSNTEDGGWDIVFTTTGITIDSTILSINASGGKYLIQAYSPIYSKPTDGSKIGINSGKAITYTQGLGNSNIQETTISQEVDLSAFAGQTAYIVKGRGLVPVGSNQGLNVGQNRLQADKWGTTTADGLYKTTDKHGSAESATGFVSASSYHTTHEAYFAFNKNPTVDNVWTVATNTISHIEYDTTDYKKLDSFRMSSGYSSARVPKRWKLTAINESGIRVDVFTDYEVSDFTISDAYTWSSLFSVSSTALLRAFRIEITANNGDATYTEIAEIEFNFAISDAPYLNTLDKVVYDENDIATEEVMLGSVKVDEQGNTFELEEEPILTSCFNDIVANEIEANEFIGKNACTAWVNFDGSTTPPTIRDSFNISSVVRISTGTYDIYFEEDMDNVNYTTIGTSGNNSTSLNVVCQPSNTTPVEKSKFRIVTPNGDGTVNTNSPSISVEIKGGKN